MGRVDDLIAFVTARLGDLELAAKIASVDDAWGELRRTIPAEPGTLNRNHRLMHEVNPARALREVEAGRRILARYADCLARMEDPDYPAGVARDQAREYEDFVLPNLAATWNDHPGYDQDWEP